MIKKSIVLQLLLLAGLFCHKQANAQQVCLNVTNPTSDQRQEVVEADLDAICRALGLKTCDSLVVMNALGQQMTYQASHDGKLLLFVSMLPKGVATYTIAKGQPLPFVKQVGGRIYPERLDDLAWENDRGIYRVYGPALQRRGERSFGTDVWVKNTPDPVVEERYRLHNWGWHQGDSLRKAGKREAGEEMIRNTSFHMDHGYGMDVYSVGPSLGCGAPALMKDGGLIFPYCFTDCKILDNGPLRFTAELTYGTTAEGKTEHRLITLDKGSHYNKMTVWYDGIREPVTLATGVVVHGEENVILGKNYVLYADPTDNPKVHQSQIYVGTLFPEGVDETMRLEGKPAHAIGLVSQYKGEPYTYYFGSAWSNYDVRTLAHWQLLAEDYLSNIRQPLTVKLEIKDFVKGADVGFLTMQEKRGVVFHDRNGRERECLELLKNDYQISAIRMRVWVNPRGGDCDKFALLAMAKRVKALGMDLMVDFHYSDWWADPAKQPIPKAWLGHSFEEMKQDVRNHTIEVLSLLKENGIAPRWVQVGNETTNGMLWSVKTNEQGWEIKDSLGHTIITHSMGHIKTEPQQYAGFIRAGYDAVKEVFPDAIVIVHLDRGHEQRLYDQNLDTILKYGGKFDMVGMSLYPYWAMDGHPELKADDIITDCIKNIRHVSEKYQCDVIIVETGYEVDESHPEKMEEGRRLLTRVIRESRSETNGHCRGVFYWEPQCLPGGYKLGAFDSKAAPTVIMDGFLQ